MAYQKQNFVNGQVLTADHMKHIEDGIALYTELSRVGATVTVICHGLTVGETYALHLYTAARRRGNQHDEWRHPSNENTGYGYTGKGYANLMGQYTMGTIGNPVYPAVPDWMPNHGMLKTEWEFTAANETEKIEINIRTWILPMLKPMVTSTGEILIGEYGIIGVCRNKAPLLMQFRLAKGSTVGECRNTLCVGMAKNNDKGNVSHIYLKYDDYGNTVAANLYTSIR